MPIIFVGHGSPMNAIENNIFTDGFAQIVKDIEKPKAILCISAHFYIKGTNVTAMKSPKTIHDFYGFPKELYEIEYPAKGDTDLAEEIIKLLSPNIVDLDNEWGLDHGAWTVLRHMYPGADVPVVQLSIDNNLSAKSHFELAKKLSSLRSKNILIIGSGNIVHNLNDIDFSSINKLDSGFEWADKARNIINEYIINNDINSLINYISNKELDLAIPTPDHYLPLIYILALKNDGENVRFFNDSVVGGSISMTSIRIG